MKLVAREIRRGLRDARWGLYVMGFAAILVPIAILAAAAVEGRITAAPSALGWFFVSLAAVASCWLAGIADTPRGTFGKLFWALTGVVLALSLQPAARRDPGNTKVSCFRYGRWELVVSVTALFVKETARRSIIDVHQSRQIRSLRVA